MVESTLFNSTFGLKLTISSSFRQLYEHIGGLFSGVNNLGSQRLLAGPWVLSTAVGRCGSTVGSQSFDTSADHHSGDRRLRPQTASEILSIRFCDPGLLKL
jgi:hypothetical protein